MSGIRVAEKSEDQAFINAMPTGFASYRRSRRDMIFLPSLLHLFVAHFMARFVRDGAWGVLSEAHTLVCKKNIHDRVYLSIGVTSGIGAGLCRVPGGVFSGVPG